MPRGGLRVVITPSDPRRKAPPFAARLALSSHWVVHCTAALTHAPSMCTPATSAPFFCVCKVKRSFSSAASCALSVILPTPARVATLRGSTRDRTAPHSECSSTVRTEAGKRTRWDSARLLAYDDCVFSPQGPRCLRDAERVRYGRVVRRHARRSRRPYLRRRPRSDHGRSCRSRLVRPTLSCATPYC